MRKLLLTVLSLTSYLACPSQGSELYTFEYTALSGPVESLRSSGIFDTSGAFERIGQISSVDPTGTITLDVTDLPEPSGLGLVVAGLSVLGGLLVMKTRVLPYLANRPTLAGRRPPAGPRSRRPISQATSDTEQMRTPRAVFDYWIASAILIFILGFWGRSYLVHVFANHQPASPQEANQHINAGLLYYNSLNDTAAEWEFRKALELDPRSALAYNDLGSVLNRQGRWDEAITVLRKAVDLDPSSQLARNNLAFATDRRRPQPTNGNEIATANLHINVGLALYNAGNYVAAEQEFRKAVAADPRSALAYNDLGSALNRRERWEEAITVLTKAIELDPSFQLAKNNLVYSISQKALGNHASK